MATATATVQPTSPWLGGRQWRLTGLTADGSTINSATLTGFPQRFICDPAQVRVRAVTTSASHATPLACSAAFDESTYRKDPNDPTQVLIDVYATAGAVAVILEIAGS